MNTTHTPGPWRLGIESDDEQTQVIVGDGGHLCYVECDPHVANAYLITAAPDMLAVLQEVYEWLDNLYDVDTRADGSHRESPSEGGRILAILRAAIAKAEGGTP